MERETSAGMGIWVMATEDWPSLDSAYVRNENTAGGSGLPGALLT